MRDTLVRACRRALIRLSADHLGRLRIDQRLEHQLHTPVGRGKAVSALGEEIIDRAALLLAVTALVLGSTTTFS